MRIARGQRLSATRINRMAEDARRGRHIIDAGHSTLSAGGHVRRRHFQYNPYSGPFKCSLAKDDSGDVTEIHVGQGYVFAGDDGYHSWDSDSDGNFDSTTDYGGAAFQAANYCLVMAIDVDPDTGDIDMPTYGPMLKAVKTANISTIQSVVSNNEFDPDGAPDAFILQAAVIILCTFDISGAAGTFSNLIQRWKWNDIYVPVHGYISTSTSEGEWDTYHAYDVTLDQDADYGWYECGFLIKLDNLERPLNVWMNAHTHDVTGSTATTDSHTHTADGTLDATTPDWT